MSRLFLVLSTIVALAGCASCAHGGASGGDCASKAAECPSQLITCAANGECACIGRPDDE